MNEPSSVSWSEILIAIIVTFLLVTCFAAQSSHSHGQPPEMEMEGNP